MAAIVYILFVIKWIDVFQMMLFAGKEINRQSLDIDIINNIEMMIRESECQDLEFAAVDLYI